MATTSKPCQRCKSPSAPFALRNAPTCGPCFTSFVDLKIGRRLGVINRETNPSKQPAPRRYLVGLSGGPSSTALVKVLDESAKYHSSKRSSTAFDPHVVHVDTGLSDGTGAADKSDAEHWGKLEAAFANVTFERVRLSRALELDTIDWTRLGPEYFSQLGDQRQVVAAEDRLRNLFDNLPSATSRADVQRLLVRHVLLHMAMEGGYNTLLLGHNTTSLAALTLSEVANGRGFSVPLQVNDGPVTVTRYLTAGSENPGQGKEEAPPRKVDGSRQVSVYFPVREIFRHEILTYLDLTPSLKALVREEDYGNSSTSKRSMVVSHKDLSIDEVTRRYFETTEGPYSGIVANVVKTAGKLDRVDGDEPCGLCGMTLDELGDTTWAGQMGDDDGPSWEGDGGGTLLCYGCKRSMHG